MSIRIGIGDNGNNTASIDVYCSADAVTDVNVSGFSYATFEWATVTVEFYEKNSLRDSKEFTYYGDDGTYTVDVDFSDYSNNLALNVIVNARYLIFNANGGTVGPGYIDRSAQSGLEPVIVYSAPKFDEQPKLALESFKNGKLLLSNKWYLKFYEATTEPSDNIDSYSITIRKNGLAINFTVLTELGNMSSSDTQLDLTKAMFRSCGSKFTFDPAGHGFKVGDSIDLIIKAFAYDGAGNLLPSATIGNSYIVDKSCTIQTKQNGSWTEGDVFVKVNGAWKEADAVYVKVNGEWKESI